MIEQYKKYLNVKDYGIIDSYKEDHRYFHTLEHLETMFKFIDSVKEITKISESELKCLYVATWFHDVIYNPTSKTNEIDSMKVFVYSETLKDLSPKEVAIVNSLILNTIDHKVSDYLLINIFIRADLNILIKKKFKEEAVKLERQIRNEYKFVNKFVYIYHRIKILKDVNLNFELDIKHNINFLLLQLFKKY